MAEKWVTNDSAREMARKYNAVCEEVNNAAYMVYALNESRLTLKLSEFTIENSPEDSDNGI